jgi:hypothetical protein
MMNYILVVLGALLAVRGAMDTPTITIGTEQARAGATAVFQSNAFLSVFAENNPDKARNIVEMIVDELAGTTYDPKILMLSFEMMAEEWSSGRVIPWFRKGGPPTHIIKIGDPIIRRTLRNSVVVFAHAAVPDVSIEFMAQLGVLLEKLKSRDTPGWEKREGMLKEKTHKKKF